MISDAPERLLFGTRTPVCRVTVNRVKKGEELIFDPSSSKGEGEFKNLFGFQSGNRLDLESKIAKFLSLNEGSTDLEWRRIAEELGPLFTEDYLFFNLDSESESMNDWLAAKSEMAILWKNLEILSQIGNNNSLSYDDVRNQFISSDSYEDILKIDPKIQYVTINGFYKKYDFREFRTSDLIDLILIKWLHWHNSPIIPRINPKTLKLELNFPLGIQALFFMCTLVARNDAKAFPRQCARPGCMGVAFIRGRKAYCSSTCQETAKSARYRKNQKNKRQT